MGEGAEGPEDKCQRSTGAPEGIDLLVLIFKHLLCFYVVLCSHCSVLYKSFYLLFNPHARCYTQISIYIFSINLAESEF